MPELPPPQTTRRVRVAFCDVDGTLLDYTQSTTAENCRAIARAADAGILVVPATGRTPFSTRVSVEEAVRQVKATNGHDSLVASADIKFAPGVYMQGNLVLDERGTAIHVGTVGSAVVRDVVKAVRHFMDEGLSVVALYPDGKAGSTSAPEAIAVLGKYHDVIVPEPDLDRGPRVEEVVKLIVVAKDSAQCQAVREVLGPAMSGRAELTGAGISVMIEVLPFGSSKGHGCLLLAKHLGFQVEEVMAIGDAENDTEMLRNFPHSFAMGGADPKVKAAAKFITVRCECSGVAEALDRVLVEP